MVITVDRGENIDGVWKGCENDMNALVKSVTECWKNIMSVLKKDSQGKLDFFFCKIPIFSWLYHLLTSLLSLNDVVIC